MSTIHDVAELAHVSIATVSRVVNQHPSVSEDTPTYSKTSNRTT